MDNKELKKMWSVFLLETENTLTSVAGELGTSPQNLGKKINNGSIRFVELCSILELYGYTIDVRGKN